MTYGGLTKCFPVSKVYDCHDSSPWVDLEDDMSTFVWSENIRIKIHLGDSRPWIVHDKFRPRKDKWPDEIK